MENLEYQIYFPERKLVTRIERDGRRADGDIPSVDLGAVAGVAVFHLDRTSIRDQRGVLAGNAVMRNHELAEIVATTDYEATAMAKKIATPERNIKRETL